MTAAAFTCPLCGEWYRYTDRNRDQYWTEAGDRMSIGEIGDQPSCRPCMRIARYRECIRMQILPKLTALLNEAIEYERCNQQEESITVNVLDMATLWLKEEAEGLPSTYPLPPAVA